MWYEGLADLWNKLTLNGVSLYPWTFAIKVYPVVHMLNQYMIPTGIKGVYKKLVSRSLFIHLYSIYT